MGRVYEKWHICKCLVFHAENLVKVYTQKNSGYTKSRRKIRQQKIPKINSKFLHIEILSREAWASKDTRFLTLSIPTSQFGYVCCGAFPPRAFVSEKLSTFPGRKGPSFKNCRYLVNLHLPFHHRLLYNYLVIRDTPLCIL